MPIYKRCSRCGKRLRSGITCECRKKRHTEYDRMSRDKRSKGFYGGGEWEFARRDALEVDGGIDVYMYMTQGVIVLADTVHHIIPLRDDWERRTEIGNLMSLNHDTHSMIETLYKQDKARIQQELAAMLTEYRSIRKG